MLNNITENMWNLLEVVGSSLSIIVAIAAVFVALYVNHDAKSPQVIAYLEYDLDHSGVIFVVKNFGDGVARNVSINDFDYSFAEDSYRDSLAASFIAGGIPVLVPGAFRSAAINHGAAAAPFEESVIEIKVSYDSKGFPFGIKRNEEVFLLEYKSFFGSRNYTSDLHRGASAVERIGKTLDKMQRDNRKLIGVVEGLATDCDIMKQIVASNKDGVC